MPKLCLLCLIPWLQLCPLLAAPLLAAPLLAAPLQARDTLLVAVATNFRATLEQLNPDFERRYDVDVELSSAATGVLYNQIRHGAPFHLLLAADEERPRLLEQAGLTVVGQRFCYAQGRLALLGGSGGLAQLADPNLSLALANPATAPYGSAAAEVLDRPEFATGQARKLVTGINVAQAFQFWRTGSVDLALVAHSQTLSPERREATLVPADWHRPLRQEAVLLRAGGDLASARHYLAWLRSPATGAHIRAAGYDACR